jgi:hypothetical protein
MTGPRRDLDHSLSALFIERASDIETVVPWRSPPGERVERSPRSRRWIAASAAAATVVAVALGVLLTRNGNNHAAAPTPPPQTSRPSPSPSAITTPSGSATVSPTSPPVRSSTPTTLAVSCTVTMPASWYHAISGGALDITAAVNRPISIGQDGAVLIQQTSVTARGITTAGDFVLVDADGSTHGVWTSPDVNHYLAEADATSAISDHWVVFLVDHVTTHGGGSGSVIAYDRANGTLTTIATTSVVNSTRGYAQPVVNGDLAYWESGTVKHPSVVGEDLATHHTVVNQPAGPAPRLIRLDTDVFLETGQAPIVSIDAIGPGNLPDFVRTAVEEHGASSDGTRLYWTTAESNAYTLNTWTPGSSTITSQQFDSARGLNIQVNYPYVQPTPDGNPGSTSDLQDLPDRVNINLTHALILNAIAGGYAVFTRSTAEHGPTTIYRTRLNQLPTPKC